MYACFFTFVLDWLSFTWSILLLDFVIYILYIYVFKNLLYPKSKRGLTFMVSLHLLIQAASQATIANKKSNTAHLKAEGPFRLELDSIRMSHHALSSF